MKSKSEKELFDFEAWIDDSTYIPAEDVFLHIEAMFKPYYCPIMEEWVMFWSKIWWFLAVYDLKDIYKKFKANRQRIKRGYSYRDLWDLGYYVMDIVEKGSLDLAKTTHGYPATLESMEEWKEILFKISEGARLEKKRVDHIVLDKDEEVKRKEGLALFIEYVGGMWD